MQKKPSHARTVPATTLSWSETSTSAPLSYLYVTLAQFYKCHWYGVLVSSTYQSVRSPTHSAERRRKKTKHFYTNWRAEILSMRFDSAEGGGGGGIHPNQEKPLHQPSWQHRFRKKAQKTWIISRKFSIINSNFQNFSNKLLESKRHILPTAIRLLCCKLNFLLLSKLEDSGQKCRFLRDLVVLAWRYDTLGSRIPRRGVLAEQQLLQIMSSAFAASRSFGEEPSGKPDEFISFSFEALKGIMKDRTLPARYRRTSDGTL